ncbi:MAG: type II toxin-antitoxin system VapC family toxin [Chitinophagales bacterium]|nr:type II toxin-antitoxin system VapC family toxin [Chitinophagales bacterium]
MTKYVFDSYALLAFFGNEKGASQVAKALTQISMGEAEGFLSVINLGEVYYMSVRKRGEAKARFALQHVQQFPIEIVTVTAEEALEAAAIKAHYKISYADAFALALSIKHKATLITGDPEFKVFKNKIKIQFINK